MANQAHEWAKAQVELVQESFRKVARLKQLLAQALSSHDIEEKKLLFKIILGSLRTVCIENSDWLEVIYLFCIIQMQLNSITNNASPLNNFKIFKVLNYIIRVGDRQNSEDMRWIKEAAFFVQKYYYYGIPGYLKPNLQGTEGMMILSGKFTRKEINAMRVGFIYETRNYDEEKRWYATQGDE